MAKNDKKNKVGRPKKEINTEIVFALASVMATQDEIANVLGISKRTLLRSRDFVNAFKKGIEEGKTSLRRHQFELSKTNATMAIWLGKQYLNQKDRIENVDSGEINITFGGKSLKDHINN